MGVNGLWKLIEPVGKPIPLESLENKVLAIDVSIWLYQLTKGLQTTGGGAVPNAHIIGLFNRICKLLYYRIKPIFVFDGGVPLLKKETIEIRKKQKRKAKDSSEELREKWLHNLLKQNAVNELLGKDAVASTSRQDESDLFALPSLPEKDEDTLESSDEESDTEVTTAKVESLCDYIYGKDVHSIDITSEQFKTLPPEIRHEVLSELIETRKQSSWGRLQEMKTDSNFSNYQMKRLMKRRNVQRSLDEAAKEMGGRMMTLGELEDLFREDGIVTDSLPGRRIAKDNVTQFIYVMGDKKSNKDITEQKCELEKKNQKPVTSSATSVQSLLEEDVDEGKFLQQSFEIDQNVFVRDSNSDEEFEVGEEYVDDYAKRLSQEEKLSQDEILRLIKTRQSANSETLESLDSERREKFPSKEVEYSVNINSTESLSPSSSSLMDEKVDLQIVSSLPVSESKESQECEAVLNDSLDMIEDSQTVSSSSSMNIRESQLENISEAMEDSERYSTILENNRTSEKQPASELCKQSNVSDVTFEKEQAESGSVELFRESDSDDGFIEVTSSCSDEAELESMEITIDPSKHDNEDDIFADVFQTNLKEDESGNPKKTDIQQKFEENKVQKVEKRVAKDDAQSKHISEVLQKTKSIIQEKEISPQKLKIIAKPQEPPQQRTEENEKLLDAQRVLYEEELELQSQFGKQERLGSTITQQMIIEAQELLRLFGLPYVIAPMEAEAQCAFLDRTSLTEGTITDDSDIWLFGGKNVYKNFFDNRKFVLQFRNIDIEHFFKLSREQLIQMALLVGSDYTMGIEGVGPVTAIEILAYFSDKTNKPETEADIADALRKFKCWIQENRNNYSSALSRKVKNVRLSEEFPSLHVIEAYLYPTVDESREAFTWGAPDLDQIRRYMKTKFAWKQSRIDDILLPVMKKLNTRQKQTTLDAFFKAKPHASIDTGNVSDRVIRAINIMKNKIDVDVSALPAKSPRKKRKLKMADGSLSKKSPSKEAKNQKSKNLLEAFSPSKPSTSTAHERIPQREMSRLEAAKRKMEAAEVLRKSRRNQSKKKQGVLPPKKDSSYLSESSSGDD